MRIRETACAGLVLVPLMLLLLAGCSSAGTSVSSSEVTCSGELATVVHRERTDDTMGSINSELNWLVKNCSAEYAIFTDYVSAKAAAQSTGVGTCGSLVQYIRAEAIALLSDDGLCSGGPAGPPTESPTSVGQPGGSISWDDAVNHAGTTQRVCGPLAGTGNSNDDVFLDLGREYPDPERFQIVLWDIGSLAPIPLGATLCTSGPITLYEGIPQIELRSSTQVEIYK